MASNMSRPNNFALARPPNKAVCANHNISLMPTPTAQLPTTANPAPQDLCEIFRMSEKGTPRRELDDNPPVTVDKHMATE